MEAPRLPSIFKSRRASQFTYRPFYYDADREEREKRNRHIIAEAEAEKHGDNAAFESKIRMRWEQSRFASKQQNRSNLRLIAVIIVLLTITYYLLG